MSCQICIIDYIGNCDQSGKPIGHPIKVLNEYTHLLKEDVSLSLIIPNNYRGKVNLESISEIKWLKRFVDITATKFNKRIINIAIRIKNLLETENYIKEKQIVWFINTDYFLLLYLAFSPKKRRYRIWLTSYFKEYNQGNSLKNRIYDFIYTKGINKVDKLITSDPNDISKSNKLIFLPDYFYNPDFYQEYSNIKKKKLVLCIGTMTGNKDIEGIIDIFSEINMPLKIVGKFTDQNRLSMLLNKVSNNIQIIDQYLSQDDYYSLIAESLYVILPYKEKSYYKRSSGILLEAIFLDSIVIAPSFLLKFNKINGISYEKLTDLINIFKGDYINEIDNSGIKQLFDINNIKKQIINMMG